MIITNLLKSFLVLTFILSCTLALVPEDDKLVTASKDDKLVAASESQTPSQQQLTLSQQQISTTDTQEAQLLNPKSVEKILRLRAEVAKLETIVLTQESTVKDIVGKEQKKGKKKNKKGKSKKSNKPSKEAALLAKKKTELSKAEAEVVEAGFDITTEILKSQEISKVKAAFKALKTDLKQYDAEWSTFWLTHPDNTGHAEEKVATDVIDVVQNKISKLQNKLKEQIAKLDWLKKKETNTNAVVEEIENGSNAVVEEIEDSSTSNA